MPHFVPCTACSRHVLESEPQCPFCSAALTLAAPARPRAPNGARRAQLFALGASLAAASCSDQPESPPPDAAPIYDAMAPASGESSDTRTSPTGNTSSTASGDTSEADSSEPGHTSGDTTSDSTQPAPVVDAGAADAAAADAGDASSGSSTGEADTSTGSDSSDSFDWSGPTAQPVYGAVPVDPSLTR